MAIDDDLADRLRMVLQDEDNLTEQRMFGGLAFLVDRHMAVAASSKGGLMLRVDPAELPALLDLPHAHPFEMRGKELAGWLRIDDAGCADDDELRTWVRRGVAYARSLPPKE